MMNASSTAAIAAANAVSTIPSSVSSEDLSQSLSEYTDADESISAPTEFLAEFLSAVMLKDYKKALKYCKLILKYEPNNSTAKEFYPLIINKLQVAASSDSDENYNSPELQSSDPEEAVSGAPEPLSRMDSGADEFGVSEDNSSGEPNSNYSNMSSSNCVSPDESFSESLDEEKDMNGEPDLVNADEGDDANSSSGDDLPIDEPNGLDEGACADFGHASQSSSGGEGRSRSDNTTHSYSSLLLEEEDDIVPNNLHFSRNLSAHDLDVANGNKIPSASCSDSESPTEPLTQRLAAILRSTCGVTDNK